MKSTGVVRRIDELGRIVLPKEIRKVLKIKAGDNLEIFMNDKDIVLSKYNIFDDKKDLFDMLANSVLGHTKKSFIITDTSRIVAGSKYLIDKEVSDDLDTLMFSRNSKIGNKEICICSNVLSSHYCYSSIVSNSDVCGIVVIFDDTITPSDFELCKFISRFISKYLEEWMLWDVLKKLV